MNHPYRDPDVEPRPIKITDDEFWRAIDETGFNAAKLYFLYIPAFSIVITFWAHLIAIAAAYLI